MRRILMLLTLACMAVSASPAFAGVKADSVAFQGRLTDASDNPVPDGPRDLTLSIWSDSIGGTMLHSEIRVVTVSKGLYSTCIGCGNDSFFDIFTDQSVYLQVQLAGSPPMSPRTPLRSVPFSISSSGVHGQASGGGAIVSAAVSSVGNLGGGGGGAAAASYARMSADSDADGVDDNEGAIVVTPTTSSVAIKTKGTGADKNRSAVSSSTNLDSASVVCDHDSDGDGVAETSVSSSSSPEVASLSINGINSNAMPNRISMNMTVGKQTQSASFGSRCYVDSDNNPESEILQSVTPTTCGVAINQKGTGADKGRTASSGCDDSSAVQTVSVDNNGNGHAESHANLAAVLNGNVVIGCAMDKNDDGTDDNGATMIVTPTTCGVAINQKGTGADKNRTISSTTYPDSLVQLMTSDDDGDGIPEAKSRTVLHGAFTGGPGMVSLKTVDFDDDGNPEGQISQILTPTTCGVAINQKGTGADKGRTAGSSCDDSSSVNYLDLDDDGDGIFEAKAVSSVSSVPSGGGGASSAAYAATGRWYTDSDDDGVPEGDISQFVTPTTCSVAIKTRGTGADKNRTISSQCDDSGAVQTLSADEDGDGFSDASIKIEIGAAGHKSATVSSHCDSDDDGVPDQEIDQVVAPGTCSVAIKTKGTGADKNRVIGATDDTTATVFMATDSASISMRVRKGGVVKGNITVNNASALRMVGLGSDGNGYFASGVGVGVDPTHHIDVAGGAYCDGTTWVNASDRNVKENFQAVDGGELLEKISDLEITKWNYIGDTETEHIGPTAQDFQQTFGVGSDGKSISTIDPSGIALAAIKELNKQNQELKVQSKELKDQNVRLQKELDDLKAKVEKLIANK